MTDIIIMMLVSGEEIVGEFISHDDRQINIKRPVVVEQAEMDGSIATRLSRYLSFDSGEETIFYLRHVIASAVCSKKIVDYYKKTVDKCYNDIFQEIAKPGEDGGITAEEIMALVSGRITVQ